MLDLRPDKNLLDKNFNGYKLSLDSIPVYRQELHNGVHQVFPNEDQFSFVHMKLFSLHNHLFADPWQRNSVYFLDNTLKINKVCLNNETGRMLSVDTVWDLPLTSAQVLYNVCVNFPSKCIAIVSDGSGMLYIINRSENKWKVEFSGTTVKDPVASTLVNSCLQNDSILHCILLNVEAKKQSVDNDIQNFNKHKPSIANTILHWISFSRGADSVWSLFSEKKLEGNGFVDYVAIEPGCECLYIASNNVFKFVYDSVNPVVHPTVDKVVKEKIYTWKQSDDDIQVMFRVISDVTRNDVEVNITELSINIAIKGEVLLQGELFHAVDTDLTTWSINEQRLEITIIKKETGLMWQYLVKDNNYGEEIIDSAVAAEVHSRLSHLCYNNEVNETGEGCAPAFNLEQLEECDSLPEEMATLSRLDGNTHMITHQISLGGHQWIMSTIMNPESVPAFCIRHDVDACIWQLEAPSEAEDASWPCSHVGTFLAFGYVSASKQQRKFTLCSPDLSYAVICEAANHVFVYKKSSVLIGTLRNRVTGTEVDSVAKQQLIKLDTTSPIIGAFAANNVLFLLTTDFLCTYFIE